jgi:hypothetical protein
MRAVAGFLQVMIHFHQTTNLSSDVLERFLVGGWQVVVFWDYSELQDSDDL